MTKLTKKRFEAEWKRGEIAIDAILNEWKTKKTTREEMIERIAGCIDELKDGKEMVAFTFVILAERLIRGEQSTIE